MDEIFHPSPRHVRLSQASGALSAAFLSLLLLIAPVVLAILGWTETLPWTFAGIALTVWAILAIGLFSQAVAWPPIAHRYKEYRLAPRVLEIRRGVLWRERIAVPRSRVQHIDVKQGPIERRFGLATLVTYTAGTQHSAVAMPGLDHDLALRLRDELAAQGEVDDAV